MSIKFVLLLIAYYAYHTNGSNYSGLIAYDCASDNLNMTTLSLYKPDDCKHYDEDITIVEINAQVVQRKKLYATHVIQCSIMTERKITHCGMHSHSSEVSGSYKHEIKILSYDQCKRLLDTEVYEYDSTIKVWGIHANSTSRGEFIVAGYLENSSCKGSTYITPEFTWLDVIVMQKYEIKLYDYVSTVDLSKDIITLRNGLKCKYSEGSCVDSIEGMVTWSTSISGDCIDKNYASIYYGPMNKTIGASKMHTAIYSVISDNALFSIKALKMADICGHPAYETDHQDILIVEIHSGIQIVKSTEMSNNDLDMFTYFNSKINFVEGHIKSQLIQMYKDLKYDMCLIDHKIVSTQVILAKLYPNDFANELMKQEGYTAVVAGEVIYIIKCKPVYVTFRKLDQCYHEIPVTYNNVSWFMAPITRVLQMEGQSTECSAFLPAKYRFSNRWYTIEGRLRDTTPPDVIALTNVPRWEYTDIPALMSTGIYSNDQVAQMKNVIYENSMQRSSSSYMHRIVSGQSVGHTSFDISRAISPDIIESALTRYWHKAIGYANWLGSFASTVLGFWFIFRIVKFIVDTFIHGKMLYELYGLGWQLLASIWDSLTNFLAHKHVRKQDTSTMQHQECLTSYNVQASSLYPDLEHSIDMPCPTAPTTPFINSVRNQSRINDA